jgi:hypothetical protein
MLALGRCPHRMRLIETFHLRAYIPRTAGWFANRGSKGAQGVLLDHTHGRTPGGAGGEQVAVPSAPFCSSSSSSRG